ELGLRLWLGLTRRLHSSACRERTRRRVGARESWRAGRKALPSSGARDAGSAASSRLRRGPSSTFFHTCIALATSDSKRISRRLAEANTKATPAQGRVQEDQNRRPRTAPVQTGAR